MIVKQEWKNETQGYLLQTLKRSPTNKLDILKRSLGYMMFITRW